MHFKDWRDFKMPYSGIILPNTIKQILIYVLIIKVNNDIYFRTDTEKIEK